MSLVRKNAPNFSGEAWYQNDFKTIHLSDYKGKYLLLFFYPLDFTFVCPTEIIAFSNHAKSFRETGCEVVACSVDSKFSHMEYSLKSRKEGGLGEMDIPLLSDVNKKIARDYGCLIDEGGDEGVAFRATYIIDGKGVVRHVSINDLPVGRNPNEYLRLVKAFQYTD
jgi:peroxiredoxin (alkyl hydroperoxide reductase subunit C)